MKDRDPIKNIQSLRITSQERFENIHNDIAKEVNAINKMVDDFTQYLQGYVGQDYLETFYSLMDNEQYRCNKGRNRTEIFFRGDDDFKIIIEYEFGIITQCHSIYEPLKY